MGSGEPRVQPVARGRPPPSPSPPALPHSHTHRGAQGVRLRLTRREAGGRGGRVGRARGRGGGRTFFTRSLTSVSSFLMGSKYRPARTPGRGGEGTGGVSPGRDTASAARGAGGRTFAVVLEDGDVPLV